MDLTAALEFAKLFGFPSLCLAVLTLLLWRAGSWCGREIVKPTADDLRGMIRLAGPAAIQVRDGVNEIKETTQRIETRLAGRRDRGQDPLPPSAGNPVHA